jgi:phage terminase large subunit-like protein
VGGTFLPNDIAIGSNGTVYADTTANNDGTDTTAIIAICPDRNISTLWTRHEQPGYPSRAP